MRITRITVERVKNLGGYESERIQAEGTVEDGESPDDAAFLLRQWVEDTLGIPQARRATPHGEHIEEVVQP